MKSIPSELHPHHHLPTQRKIGLLTFSVRYVLEHLLSQVRENGRERTDQDVQNLRQRGLAGAPLGVAGAFTVEPEREHLPQQLTSLYSDCRGGPCLRPRLFLRYSGSLNGPDHLPVK